MLTRLKAWFQLMSVEPFQYFQFLFRDPVILDFQRGIWLGCNFPSSENCLVESWNSCVPLLEIPMDVLDFSIFSLCFALIWLVPWARSHIICTKHYWRQYWVPLIGLHIYLTGGGSRVTLKEQLFVWHRCSRGVRVDLVFMENIQCSTNLMKFFRIKRTPCITQSS